MTIAEVNAEIAKAKGWERSSYSAPDLMWRDPVSRHCHNNPTDDPREWASLLEEMLAAGVDLIFTSDGLMKACKGSTGDAEAFCAVELWKPSIGDGVCRVWLVFARASIPKGLL